MPIQLFLHFHKTICSDHAEIEFTRQMLLTCIHNLCFIIKSLWSWLETVLLDFGLEYLVWYAGICLLEGTSDWWATFRNYKGSTFSLILLHLFWNNSASRKGQIWNMKYSWLTKLKAFELDIMKYKRWSTRFAMLLWLMESKNVIIACKPFLETSWLFQDAETQSEDDVAVISISPEKCYQHSLLGKLKW